MDMLRRRFIPAIQRKRFDDINAIVFQQNEAPSHYSNLLKQYFPEDKLFSRTDNPWPPHFPTSYFLRLRPLELLPRSVYENNPSTIEKLLKNIKCEIRKFRETCWSALLTILMKGGRCLKSVGLGSNISITGTRNLRKKLDISLKLMPLPALNLFVKLAITQTF